MKKIILLVSVMALSISGQAQQELLNTDWTLHYMVIDGDTIHVTQPHPSNPFYDPKINFYEIPGGYDVSAFISFNTFGESLPPSIIDETTIAIQGPSITLGDCDYCVLEGQYFGTILYGDGASPRIFDYEIIDGTDATKTLILNTPEGNTAVHGNFILSVNEFERNSIAVHPNPVRNVLTIDSEVIAIEKATVYSLLGERVFEKSNMNQTSSIDVSFLPSGIYFAQITVASGNTYIYRFIKE